MTISGTTVVDLKATVFFVVYEKNKNLLVYERDLNYVVFKISLIHFFDGVYFAFSFFVNNFADGEVLAVVSIKLVFEGAFSKDDWNHLKIVSHFVKDFVKFDFLLFMFKRAVIQLQTFLPFLLFLLFCFLRYFP